MSNKVETTIAYKLDARGLRDARRELEKSFKPESVKALNAALKDARARVKDLSAEYGRAAKAQGAMANLPKQLRDNIRAARDEVQRLTGDLNKQLEIERKLAELHEKERAQAKADRATAFRQGALQGFGGPLSTFLQRREGATTQQQRDELWSQFKGQMVGGAARRAFGAARAGVGMASSMVGGSGPMGTLLGNIPFLGGAAQLAEGAVGSFVERQRAQLGAFAYGGNAVTRAGRAGRAATSGRYLALGPMEDIGMTPSMKAANKAEKDALREKLAQERDTSIAEHWKIQGGGLGTRAEIVKAREAEEAGLLKRLESQQMNRLGVKRGKYVPGTPAVAGEAPKRATDEMIEAVHGLMTGTEAIQAGTAFTKQVGGRFNRGQFEQAHAAETLFGVDQGTSSSLFRAQRAGRGGGTRDPVNMLAKAIGAATAQGLDGSEINEYLEQLASMQSDAASKGLKIDTETLTSMGVALSRGLGLEGAQAGRIAGNVAGIAQGVVTQGAKGPLDIQMLRAAGFDPARGNFLETRRKLASIQEGGMDAETMFGFLSNLVGGEGDDLKRGYTLERSGLGLGTEQAIKMSAMLKQGKGAFMSSFAGEGGLTADKLLAGLSDVKGITGGIRGANAVQNQMVAAGGAAAANVQMLQQQAAALATTMATQLKPFMDPIAKNIVSLSKGIEQLVTYIGDWGTSEGIPVRLIR